MSRATHARFLARQDERRRTATAAAHPCTRCGSTELVRRYVADTDPLGMLGSVWLCDRHAPNHEDQR